MGLPEVFLLGRTVTFCANAPAGPESLIEGAEPRHVELLARSKNRSKSALICPFANDAEPAPGVPGEADTEATWPLNSAGAALAMAPEKRSRALVHDL